MPKPLVSPDAQAEREIIFLPPFEVVDSARGYRASNTASGTRLNSSVEDVGSSISVVNKRQMEDFGLIDINDIFNYEANTEGTGNFTDFTFNSSGMPMDNVQTNPQGANRIRGLNTANTNFGNFETSGRIPLDPLNIDAVEITRGPNSSIFGVGSPAGTVNSVPAAANLSKNSVKVSTRTDNRDGWRASIDLNRVLFKDRLALRVSAVRQHEAFALKPSGVDTDRLNLMLRYRPFSRTMLSASYSRYRAEGNRPNSLAPRDGISGWLAAGAPTWDPLTGTLKVNGVVTGTFTGSSNPAGFNTQIGSILGYVDQNGLSYLGQARGSSGTTPLSQTQNQRLLTPVADPSGFLSSQPLFQKYPVLSNRDLYDWSSINLAAMNRFADAGTTIMANLDQNLFRTPRHSLDVQAGMFLETAQRYQRTFLGSLSPSAGFSSSVTIDVNERLLDGSANPYFLRPFIQVDRPYFYSQPIERQTYRAQLAYQLDLRKEKSWLRWLGRHQFSAYAEYKQSTARQYTYRDALVSAHAWTDTTTNRGNSSIYVLYPRFYLGDNNGNNIDYAPTPYATGSYNLRWGNALTGAFTNEATQIAQAISADGSSTGGLKNNLTILKTQGAVLQSFLFGDRLIPTFGLRGDQSYNRLGASPVYPDPVTMDEVSFNSWAAGDWTISKGRTTTSGAVLKALPWLYLSANKSNSFTPAALGFDLYKNILPDPSGEGRDFGLWLLFFDGQLVIRANRYKTTQVNSRNGDSSNIAQRVRRLDYLGATGAAYNLQRQATAWITAANPGITADQLLDQLSAVMQLPKDLIAAPPDRPAALDDITARGTELEINYNPTDHLTLKANLTEQESINAGLAANVTQWIDDRLKVWPTIIDPRSGQPWFTTDYGGGSAQAQFTSNVVNPLQIAQAMAGKSRPQIRKYRANFLGSYKLAGLTDHKILKRFTVGGAVRWEDKGAIGFRGTQELPAIITTLDASKPIWDSEHMYFDAFVTYRTKIFSNKVGLTMQLNGRNLNEGGRLQKVAAEPDGRISAFRIVDPRLFILTVSFDL